MVEKVSEAIMKVAMNCDSAPDDGALLKQIVKKKKQKQDGENSLPAAILLPDTLVRLITTSAQGGGLQKTEKQVVKEDIPASFGLAVDTGQTNKGDSLRRQVALAFPGQTAMPGMAKKSGIVEKNETTKALSSKTAAIVHNAGPLSAKKMPAAAVTTLQHPVAVAAQQSSVAAVVNPATVNKLTSEVETGHKDTQQRKKDDFGEARPYWQGAKQPESVLPKHSETTTQSKNMVTMLQQLKTPASSAASVVSKGNESHMLEVNYQFQRWSGDHSVRISVPTTARREGNVTLLPSDARAADVLLRNMGHLTSLTPDLLRPQQERDEQQQQRRQQQQQDEDQE